MKTLTKTQIELLNSFNDSNISHPNYYTGSGRFSKKGADKAGQLVILLESLGMKKDTHFITGNDAPRGGFEGEFVKLTKGKTWKVIKDMRADYKAERAAEMKRIAKSEADREASNKRNMEIYNNAGGDEAAVAWFDALPLDEKKSMRGFRSWEERSVAEWDNNITVMKRVRKAFINSVK